MTSPAVYAVTHRRPLRAAMLTALVLAVAVATAWAVYQREMAGAGERIARLAAQVAALDAQRTRLQVEVERSRARNAVVERARQVEEQAYAQVDQNLRDLQREVLRLQRQVAFYRDIVEAGSQRQVQVQNFLLSAAEERTWSYELVLTRGRNDGKVVTGKVTLAVDGDQGQQRSTLMFPAVAGGGRGFEFRYFQRLHGRLTLPQGFVPRAIRVRVSLSGRQGNALERRFEWPVAAG